MRFQSSLLCMWTPPGSPTQGAIGQYLQQAITPQVHWLRVILERTAEHHQFQLIHAISVILAMHVDSPEQPNTRGNRAISATSNHSTSALTQGNSRANCWTSSVSANTCDFSHPCHACWFPQQPTTCHKGQYLQQAITPISTSASTQGNSRVNCWTSSVSANTCDFSHPCYACWFPQQPTTTGTFSCDCKPLNLSTFGMIFAGFYSIGSVCETMNCLL